MRSRGHFQDNFHPEDEQVLLEQIMRPKSNVRIKYGGMERTLKRNVINMTKSGRPIPIRKITNWKRVSTALEKIDTPNLNSIPNDIASTDEIDFAIGALTNHVRTVVEESEREVPASSDRRKFPPDILELIRAKTQLCAARAHIPLLSTDPERELSKRSESSRSGIRNESWSDLMEEIKPSHKAFWAVTKALKTEGYTLYPHSKPDNSVAIDDAEIAECLADSIETQCSHASPPHDIAHISRIEEEVLQKTSLEPKDDLALVSLSEVQTLVKSLNTRKAPGLDGISNKAIKCFSIPLLSLLVAIFNACIKNCYFPPAWKEAEVIGIHKPGKPRDLPASYRPISLLSGLGKLFEKILKTRLSDHLLGKGLIIDEQFGFRPAHSCPQQVLRLVEYVSEGFETERSTVAVFFDVAKAFDRVWHAGLIYKLYSLQVPDRLIITIQNYLANRHFTFRHERTHSTRRLIRAGVPQGSTLSPLLYSAYTNDVPRPSSSGVQLALFADDTALFYGSRNRSTRFTLFPLQRAIDELGQWFRKWRIEVNPDKSAAIQFKYGVTLDKNLHFRDHIERVRNTALFYKARLGAVLGRKSKLSRRNKRTIYKMCIRTVMTYASPVFAHAAPKALHRLQGLINRRIPPTLFVGHGTYLPIHLTLLQRQLKALMTSTTRMTDLEREGNRPVTVSFDILCRDDFLQASSIAHVTRRRHSHVPSGRTRRNFLVGISSTLPHVYGREGVQDRHFLPPPRRKRETKKKVVICGR
ncbi:Probable RNA-directed DNA polymerase from transposon BS [Eumeta japonica]|uniref:Probable RNA-directed DNA polymerase from transposon BS n=1 Tax=Eumeta variegata TaxID=151549 RepID=A0A4C1Y3Y7_EUMVA|nr:Probable RNA-directed DNA polymerase from transposon BS [Eumeta japonica]